mmetsp:Transcript_10076/g.18129  ORF Transcript_10076/g.18129 Transcript_10076/m.18129 type:complete len:281 (-) Transcript_10076:75-917(-)
MKNLKRSVPIGPSPLVTCHPPSFTLYTRSPSDTDGPSLISLSIIWSIFALAYPPRRKSSRSYSWDGVNSAVKEMLIRWPLLPQSAGIHVPGSLPMLREIFHLVSSNKLAIPPFFFNDDLLFVSVNTMGAGAGNKPSSVDIVSGFLLVIVRSIDDDDEEENDNFSLRSSRRRSASFLNSSISFRSSSDSASISATVAFGLEEGCRAMCSFVGIRCGWGWCLRVENAKAVEDTSWGDPSVTAARLLTMAITKVENMAMQLLCEQWSDCFCYSMVYVEQVRRM